MKKSWLVLVMMIAFFVLVAGYGKGTGNAKSLKSAMAQELSATIVSTSGGQTATMKVYMKPDKYRTDHEAAGSSTIVRRDLNKVWMIMKGQKAYMEMPGVTDEQIRTAEEKVKGEVNRKKVGSETVDGHPSIKYQVTAKADGNVVQTYQWWATDINFPVKTAAVDGSWTMEYRDIKLGKQQNSLFEIPSGYKKMTIPGMPAGMNIKIPGMNTK
jgi:hypothetical protein